MYLAPPLTGFPLELSIGAQSKKLELLGCQMVKKLKDKFSRFDTIPAYDGPTDRQTDGQHTTAKTALCIASRGYKQVTSKCYSSERGSSASPDA